MLMFAMVAALEGAVPEKLDLLCSMSANGGTVRYIFSIDPATKTYTSVMNDDYKSAGAAELTDTQLTLTRIDGKLKGVFRISRTTGDVTMDAGLVDGPVVVRQQGSCSKYSGRAF